MTASDLQPDVDLGPKLPGTELPAGPDRRTMRRLARVQAAQLDADAAVERRARQAELDREARAAQLATDRAERDARAEEERRRRAARAEESRRSRIVRRQRRAERRDAVRALAGRVRPVAPLLAVNGAAVYGQLGYGYDHLTGAGTPAAARLLIAVLVAVSAESVALYVGWHAHDALLSGASVTAARLRRASYAIAGCMGAVNYAHFAGAGLTPTPAAVVFALFSLLSPWLWGLHTRWAQHVQLIGAGLVDCPGAVFGAERRRAFPLRTIAARRWSIDHNVVDPQEAWVGYNHARAAAKAVRAADRTQRRTGRRFGLPVRSGPDGGPLVTVPAAGRPRRPLLPPDTRPAITGADQRELRSGPRLQADGGPDRGPDRGRSRSGPDRADRTPPPRTDTGPDRDPGPDRADRVDPTEPAVRTARTSGRTLDRAAAAADRNPGPRTGSKAAPAPARTGPVGTGVAAADGGLDGLLLVGRAVAADLARSGHPLTRAALREGLRARGRSISNQRAGELLAVLRGAA